METIAFLWPEEEFRATGLKDLPGYNIRFGRAGVRREAEAACQGVHYILSASGFGLVDSNLLDLAPRTRLVQLTGAGYDNVDRKECARRNIPVAYLPGMNAPSVAQTLVQVALRLLRPIIPLVEGGSVEWLAARNKNISGTELGGQVGIIGFGNIGKRVAALFQGLGLDVVRAAHGKQVDSKIPALPLEELLPTSDIIVVTLPATRATENIINQALIKLMKPSAILLNYGRGGVVDEKAVADAIRNDRLGGAGFDVFAEEPIPSTHPFFTLPPEKRAKIIVTAHIAGQTTDSKKRNFSMALDNVERVARGERPLNELRPIAAL